MDAAVAQIVSITSASPERAAQYLQLADGDLDAAVMLYLENNGADLTGGPAAEPVPPSNPAGHGGAQDPITVDDDDTISDDNDPEVTGYRKPEGKAAQGPGQTFDSDAEMARRLQEEMYGGAAPNGDEPVRAPIARQSETLLGPGADMGGFDDGNLPAHVMQQMQRIQNRRGHQGRAGIFNQRPAPNSIWNEQGESRGEADLLAASTGGASESSTRSNMLAKMYQPPWDLIYKGDWDQARKEGADEQKWMLIDIQESSVFDCQILNRDLWKNPSVVDTVKENFIFLQYSKEDPRADPYINYYFPDHGNKDSYPHIAIIDPRTGEKVKVWSTEAPKPSEFLIQLHEFLDRYSLDKTARNPVAKRKSETKKVKSVLEMTEEEQLERALQASLAADSGNDRTRLGVEDPDDLTRSVGDVHSPKQKDPDRVSTVPNGNEPAENSAFDLIASDQNHDEPAAGPQVTRIQFKHPAGRIIRRFTLTDPVRRLFEWLKADPLQGKEGVGFELVSMGNNLLEGLDLTIEEAGLKMGTVMIEFLEN